MKEENKKKCRGCLVYLFEIVIVIILLALMTWATAYTLWVTDPQHIIAETMIERGLEPACSPSITLEQWLEAVKATGQFCLFILGALIGMASFHYLVDRLKNR